MPVDEHAVWSRVQSAEVRANELHALNSGDPADLRHRLAQEFFFHLGGAVEFMAQLAAEQRRVGSPDTVTMAKLPDLLHGDALEAPLRALYLNPNKEPFPADPYDDRGYLWRIYNYRHQVTHRGANPFLITMGGPLSTTHFYLDPLDPSLGASRETIAADTTNMVDLIRRLLTNAVNAL